MTLAGGVAARSPAWREADGALPAAGFAPAKVNLTLSVRGRRADGYHDLVSLVAFASIGDEVSLTPGPDLSLTVGGPFAAAAGEIEANLVLKAARALARRVAGLRTGAFVLRKHVPVAAGLGGGSADAAAALRLLAALNRLSPGDPDLFAAAAEAGSDVPVCLGGQACVMAGRGELLGPRLPMPAMPAVIVNPGVALATASVFQALQFGEAGPAAEFAPPAAIAARGEWLAAIIACGNDLEAPALALAPAIAQPSRAIAAQEGCLLARMTGSGATVFGLFADAAAAAGAAARLSAAHPEWWVRAATLR